MCLPQPLHIAIKEEHEEIALKLLSMSTSSPMYRVDVNICDAEGDTPLIIALENDMLKVADMLISAGADQGETDTRGSGGSLEPPGPLLEPPGPLLTHLHTVDIAYSECLPTHLNPLAERACFSQVCGAQLAGCRLCAHRRGHGRRQSEKDVKLAQKLGQLQPCIAVFPQECTADLHLLGQPNTFLAQDLESDGIDRRLPVGAAHPSHHGRAVDGGGAAGQHRAHRQARQH